MRGLHKSKRISWAPDVNLCQVRLFLSEDSPSQVGLGVQDHLQVKSAWVTPPSGTSTDDILPPGFEGAQSSNQSQIKLSDIPVIGWQCPPRFSLDTVWRVVAGEESNEVELQSQREMRMLEAVYPRTSAIPPNPSISAEIEGIHYDDQQTPLIPITAIEEEEASTDIPSGSTAQLNIPMNFHVPDLDSVVPVPSVSNTHALGIDPQVAAAAITEITRSNGNGTLIDHELLVKILGNPNLMEKLVTDCGAAPNLQNVPRPMMPSISQPNHPPIALSNPSFTCSPSLMATSSGPAFYPQSNNGVGPGHHPNAWVRPPPGGFPASSSAAACGVSQTKDMNYYKNLIQQHGGERQEMNQQFGNRYNPPGLTTQESSVNNPRSSKPKINKPCIYFNSSRGCRHGANCAYQHDISSSQHQRGSSSSSMPEVQNSKRMKMDRELSS